MTGKTFIGILHTGVMALFLTSAGISQGAGTDQDPVSIRIGWPIPAPTLGQIVEVLKRTNVLERQGLNPSFVPFSYGGPSVDAALAGLLDVVFLGDQAAISLIARGGKWKILARIGYARSSILVPPHSSIKEILDLRGKTVATLPGSVYQREAFLAEQSAGLNPDRDVKTINMDSFDIMSLVRAGGGEKWGGIDAVALDPAYFEMKGLVRILSTSRVLGVIAVSENFIASHPESAVRFLVSILRAWDYFSHHPDQANQWYLDDAHLGLTHEQLTSIAKMDPSFTAKSVTEIHLQLSDDDVSGLERGAAWTRARGYSPTLAQMRTAVDRKLLDQAMKEVAKDKSEELKVIMPSAREAKLGEGHRVSSFDSIPLWAFFVLMTTLTLLSIEAGQWLGARRRRMEEHEQESAVGTVVAAVLGLLAFVIALTFGAASSRYDAGREALLDDVTAIRTAYLRAGLVPEPHKTASRLLLRDYVEIRIGMVDTYGKPDQLKVLQARAAALQDSLWSHAEALIDKDSNFSASFTESLTDVFRLQTRRVAFGAQFRIPPFVWLVVILASCIAMAVVGFQFGISGKRSFPAQLGLALTFALVMQLIYDLDRPGKGMVELNQQPMIELYESLGR